MFSMFRCIQYRRIIYVCTVYICIFISAIHSVIDSYIFVKQRFFLGGWGGSIVYYTGRQKAKILNQQNRNSNQTILFTLPPLHLAMDHD